MPCKSFPSSLPSVHVFHADITELSATDWMATQSSRLDQASLCRAAEITHVCRRDQFLLGRILLKHALQHVYGEIAADWRLELSHGGKPLLLGPKGPVGVAVSLSHSDRLVVCALAECETLGIDIERSKPRDFITLSEHVMTPAERANLAGLNPEAQAVFFYQNWTAKEACAKALGADQAPAFKQMEVRLPDSLMTEEAGGEFYAGLCWGDGEYVSALVSKDTFNEVEAFHFGADGHFQPHTLEGGVPVQIRLPEMY